MDRLPQVEATWRIYQQMISAYRDTDRAAGLRAMTTLIDALSSAVPLELTELITLGRTLKRRANDVLAYFTHPRRAGRCRPSECGSRGLTRGSSGGDVHGKRVAVEHTLAAIKGREVAAGAGVVPGVKGPGRPVAVAVGCPSATDWKGYSSQLRPPLV